MKKERVKAEGVKEVKRERERKRRSEYGDERVRVRKWLGVVLDGFTEM